MTKVSVIIPVYKVPLEFLRECFNSLLAQTMQECEFLIVSDGAPDAECSICEEYAAKDSRFRFFQREHTGVSATRNYGIEQAQGEYITFVDADDWIESENLETTYNTAKKEYFDVVFWDLCFFQNKAEILDKTSFSRTTTQVLNDTEKQRYKKNIIWAPAKKDLIPALTVCKLISKKMINQHNIFFDECLTFGEDRVFNYKISKVAKSIVYTPKAFYHYRQHANSTMHESIHHIFPKHLAYINALNEISSKAFPHEIANETIYSFYGCISKVFFSNLQPKEKISELNYLKDFIKTKSFQNLIKDTNTNLNNKLFGIEILLMKHKITWLFHARIFKFRLIWFFQRRI